MNIKRFLIGLCIYSTYQTAIACNEANVIEQLRQIETQKLLSNAPTLKHAWQDKLFRFEFKDATQESTECKVMLEMHIPQADLDEANQHLDQNPAKRILVAAQGYSVPEKTAYEVPFYYQVSDGKATANNPNSSELKSLHNNLEYTYQLLAQLRISVDENSINSILWSPSELATEMNICQKNPSYKNKAQDFCSCRTNALSKAMTPRKMELVHYIETQPFSVATGSMMSFQKLSEKIDTSCSPN